MEIDQHLSSYNYHLPSQCIAQNPVTPRDHSRLLVVDSPQTQQHCHFYQLPDFLQAGDLLVLNDTKVMPARLYGQKDNGVAVEILLLEEKTRTDWLVLVKPGKRLPPGSRLQFPAKNPQTPDLLAEIIDRDSDTGGRWVRFQLPPEQRLWELLDDYGQIPFPPYVTDSQASEAQYQTIYAEKLGAVAAPTAGLHFTDNVFSQLEHQGINIAKVTLHVGIGTFRPVETENILSHTMHQEWLDLPESTVDAIQQTKANGGRVFAVGTTVVRCLEGAAQAQSEGLDAFQGNTQLFIYPGYTWQVVDGLITNFHLPKSSLLMLVSALIGRKRLLDLYQIAIDEAYRFYSFGDAMLILPEAVVAERQTRTWES